MNHFVILSPDAQRDILSAKIWYLCESFELVDRFDADLRARLEKIEVHPRAYRLVGRTVRCALLRNFPYAIYFEIESSVVTVKAVLHQRRNDSRIWN